MINRERHRRAAIEQSKTESAVNQAMGYEGWYVKETASASHSLTCCILVRECDESKYLRKATDLVEEWQWSFQSRSTTSERSGLVLAERPRYNSEEDTSASGELSSLCLVCGLLILSDEDVWPHGQI